MEGFALCWCALWRGLLPGSGVARTALTSRCPLSRPVYPRGELRSAPRSRSPPTAREVEVKSEFTLFSSPAVTWGTTSSGWHKRPRSSCHSSGTLACGPKESSKSKLCAAADADADADAYASKSMIRAGQKCSTLASVSRACGIMYPQKQ